MLAGIWPERLWELLNETVPTERVIQRRLLGRRNERKEKKVRL